MSMPHAQPVYTVQDLMAFPEDGNRYEVVHGRLLVSPSPRQVHQLVLGRLFVYFALFLQSRPAIGRVLPPLTLRGERIRWCSRICS